MTATQ